MRRALTLSLALFLPIAVSLTGCPRQAPGTETPDSEPTAFQPTVPQGTPVFVNRGGQWVPATVVRHTGPTNVLIHYEGMPAEWDEDVVFDRVRSRPVEAAPAATAYKAGEMVLVTTQNRLLLADVLQQVEASAYQIHYSGYGPEAVEKVTTERIRRPFTGATTYPTGAAVLVQVGGPQPMPGKVLAVVAADQWLVRLDGASPLYDQQVGADRILPAAAPAPVAPTAAPTPTPAPIASTPPTAAPTAVKPPEKAPVVPPAPPAPVPLKVGDSVLLLVRSVHYPAKVVANGATAASLRVRVEGQSVDEEATLDRLTRLQEPLKNVKYQAGQLVYIEWHGVYMPGKVIKESGAGNYSVRGDEKGALDEIVQVKRLRPR